MGAPLLSTFFDAPLHPDLVKVLAKLPEEDRAMVELSIRMVMARVAYAISWQGWWAFPGVITETGKKCAEMLEEGLAFVTDMVPEVKS